jgi:hypothetical protein
MVLFHKPAPTQAADLIASLENLEAAAPAATRAGGNPICPNIAE